jgi:hypothetical protein
VIREERIPGLQTGSNPQFAGGWLVEGIRFGRGVYPPIATERVRKEMIGKGIEGSPLSHNGNDGWQTY